MKLTIYVLREKEHDWDCATDWKNTKSTIYWHEAREWKESGRIAHYSTRDFDMMQIEIPDDIVWEK